MLFEQRYGLAQYRGIAIVEGDREGIASKAPLPVPSGELGQRHHVAMTRKPAQLRVEILFFDGKAPWVEARLPNTMVH